MRISDWRSDVCSSDLLGKAWRRGRAAQVRVAHILESHFRHHRAGKIIEGFLVREEGAKAVAGDGFSEQPLGRAGHVRRSDERRVGKECGSRCRSRWSSYM